MTIRLAIIRRASALAVLGCACTETVAVDPVVVPTLEVVAGAVPVTRTVNTLVTTVPAVRILDGTGTPLEGARIRFAVTAGRGAIGSETVTTGPDGIASPGFWRYGTTAGAQQLSAALVNFTTDARAVFHGTATPGATTRLVTEPAGLTLRPGQTAQLIVNALDQYGNPTATSVAAAFMSGNEAVATVSAGGLVSAGTPGMTWVTATWLGLTDSVPVNVGTRPRGENAVITVIDSRPFSTAISPEGTVYVARVDAYALSRIDLPDVAVSGGVAIIGPAYDVAFVPDGSRAYASNVLNGSVSVIDRAANAVLRTVGGLGEIYRIDADPSGAYVYVSTSGGILHRINTATDAVQSILLGGPLNGLAVNPARGVLYASSMGGTLYEVSLAAFNLVRSVDIPGLLQGIAVSPDGTRVLVASEYQGVHVVNASSLLPIQLRGELSGAFDLALTIDGAELYVSRPMQGTVTVVDATTFAHIRSHDGGWPRRVTMSPDGTTAVIANESGWVTIVR